jgi:transposase
MHLRLTPAQKKVLMQFVMRTNDARLLRRAQALLDLNAGESPGLIAQRYQVARSTIYNWIERCETRGFSDEALSDLPRPRKSAPPPAGRSPQRRSRVIV